MSADIRRTILALKKSGVNALCPVWREFGRTSIKLLFKDGFDIICRMNGE